MSIAYVVLKLEREGQSDPPPVLPFSKKPSLGRVNKSFQKDVYEKLMRANQFELEFLDDIPNFDEMGKQIRNTLVVVDDMLTESSRNEQISALFTRGRHLNISVILLSQNLFHQGKYSRDISLTEKKIQRETFLPGISKRSITEFPYVF